MRIKFKKPDPRAGLVAQMDSKRGAQLVAAGAAAQIKDDGSQDELSVERVIPSRAELDDALASLPDDYTDADFVVGAMRAHFADLFTLVDEARVRELVPAKRAVALADIPADRAEAAIVVDAPAAAPALEQATAGTAASAAVATSRKRR